MFPEVVDSFICGWLYIAIPAPPPTPPHTPQKGKLYEVSDHGWHLTDAQQMFVK